MKRVLALIIVLIFSVSLFTACGTTPPAATVDKAETPEQAANSAADGKPVTVTVLHHMSEQTKKDGVAALIDGFKKNNPNVTFDNQYISQDNFASTLKMKVAAGDAPDVFMGRPALFTEMVKAGQALDLTDQAFTKNFQDNAFPSITIDSKIYGVPLDLGGLGMYFNLDVLKSAGLEVPRTWTEFIKACDTLKAKGITPISAMYKDAWTLSVNYESNILGNIVKKYPDYRKELMDRTKKFSDIPELRTTVEHFSKIFDYVGNDPFSIDYNTGLSNFATGKCAFLGTGSWAIGDIRKNNPQGNFQFGIYPMLDNEADQALPNYVDDCFMFSSQSKVKDTVVKFAGYLSTPEAGAIWSKTALQLSAIKDVKPGEVDPMLQNFIDIAASGKVIGFEKTANFTGQYIDTFDRKFQSFAASKDKDVTKMLADLDKDFDKIKATSK